MFGLAMIYVLRLLVGFVMVWLLFGCLCDLVLFSLWVYGLGMLCITWQNALCLVFYICGDLFCWFDWFEGCGFGGWLLLCW